MPTNLMRKPCSILRANNYRLAIDPRRSPSARYHDASTSAPRTTLATLRPQISSPPHSFLTAGIFWRSLLIGAVFNNAWLLDPALKGLSAISRSQNGLSSVNGNPLLRALLKNTLYKHFCAGENAQEVGSTIARVRGMGFKGVILTYAAEVTAAAKSHTNDASHVSESQKSNPTGKDDRGESFVEAWRVGVLKTVAMIGNGDYLALKQVLSGAGPLVTNALKTTRTVPPQMWDALGEICDAAIRQKACILVDAEQHDVQPGIDRIALDLMRRYNRESRVLVYNTYQAYLKSTSDTLSRHLDQSAQEGFDMGIKLVRGAYISSEPRHLIHDSKEQTDANFDALACRLLTKHARSDDQMTRHVRVFLGTHNKQSVLKAHELQSKRRDAGLPLMPVQYGQLLGMADEVSFTLLQLDNGGNSAEVYKCLSWGTLSECLSFLLRRVVENRDAVSRTQEEYRALKTEAVRRVRVAVGLK